ncbi:FixH family protein [Stenoxybacter acetivorans]|uniref:FixH family protein n=1 Tax=Stenoxybacter acetivorans TaxID=422441 RepID=UPI0005646C65|nr:FixH family protein [Stenoxybacter acetivorans]
MRSLSSTKKTTRPWYKEPWPWLLMAGPAIVVVAGFITFYIANTRGDSLVTDDYYKEGKNIGLQLQRDEAAVSRNIEAQILINPDNNQAKVFISGKFDPAESINLLWVHPTRKEWDQSVVLKRDETMPLSGDKAVYTADFKTLPNSNHWYVRLEDAKAQWRVQAQWLPSQGSSLNLSPMHQALIPQQQSASDSQPLR